MSILKIVTYPNPVLAKKAKAVAKVIPEIKKLIKDMLETMYKAPGVGLAAPQVGRSIRLIVIDIGEGPIALINPKVTAKHGEQTLVEGCLSLPGIEAPVKRASNVTVTGLNEKGKKVNYDAEGLLATVFQHEIDHLDGIVCIDRVADPSLIKHVVFDKEPKEERI
ncbi:MAG: peptide deformylase [Candidatus Saganbacteria bacterium]|nr:peptide deformylase [Candidatus Saganbacteria bacterium]